MIDRRSARDLSPPVERLWGAATEAIWGCRLAAARISEPVHYLPGMRRYLGEDDRPHVWTHDWYAHVLFAKRLLEAGRI